MLFNTIDFAFFLPIVFILYWFVTNKSLKLQNTLIVFASYFFYGWWDWRFLGLIFLSTIVDFTIGRGLAKEDDEQKRKWLLYISVLVNLGLLGFFKYYNFFIENFTKVFTLFGADIQPRMLNLILPVGISFYTFQTMSYTIDVYRRKLKPTNDFISFMAFVSFFPQLVAGPIERASNLLPQFYKKRTYNYEQLSDGMRQILWGLFKKVVIADSCANYYVDDIFASPHDMNASTLVLGVIFFAFQVYADFSGYSDIAIGTARLFGFDLMKNFNFPYFSRNIAEFWRRWHISMFSWFLDYIYIPLGGGRGSKFNKVRNTIIVFFVSGLWHGASWNYITYGLLNAVYIIPSITFLKTEKHTDIVAKGKIIPSFKEIMQMLMTFGLTSFAFIFFRCTTMNQIWTYIKGIFSTSILEKPTLPPVVLMLLIIIFMITEWIFREKEYGLQFNTSKTPRIVRWVSYLILSFLIAFYFGGKDNFVYFQF